MGRAGGHPRVLRLAAAATAVALVAVGVVVAVVERPRHANVAHPWAVPAPVAPSRAAPDGPVKQAVVVPPGGAVAAPAGRVATAPFEPVEVTIPSLGVTATLVAEPVVAGSLDIPSSLQHWAWWDGGSEPLRRSGPVLLAGHKDHFGEGNGPADRILGLRPGAVAYLYGAAGQYEEYVATSLQQLRKSQFAAYSAADLGAAGPSRLVVVTCGGTFDPWSGHWDSNVVATFTPI